MFRLLATYAKAHNVIRIEGFMKPESQKVWLKLIGFNRSLGCTIIGRYFIYSVNLD